MFSNEALSRLGRFLETTLNGVRGLRIENVALLHGGASRDTYSFDALYNGPAGPGRSGFILRLEQRGGLMDAERALELAAYRAVEGRGVPAPMPVAMGNDTRILGAPFVLMERVENAHAASQFAVDPYGEAAGAIGRQLFGVLGRLAAIDPYDTDLPAVALAPAPDQCWRRELDYWESVLDMDALEPQPIAKAAIRRLRKNAPPPPPRLAIVHGDLRHGNFLHNGAGRITAVLDWEMTHLGDPLEDLAWTLDPLWSLGKPDLAAGLIPQAEAVRIWESQSGLDFEPERFRWWSLFANVKGLAIWTASARSFIDGRTRNPMLAFSGWYCAARHNQIIAARLAAAPRGGL